MLVCSLYFNLLEHLGRALFPFWPKTSFLVLGREREREERHGKSLYVCRHDIMSFVTCEFGGY